MAEFFFSSFAVSLRKYFVHKKRTPEISLEIHCNRLNHWSKIFVCCSFQINVIHNNSRSFKQELFEWNTCIVTVKEVTHMRVGLRLFACDKVLNDVVWKGKMNRASEGNHLFVLRGYFFTLFFVALFKVQI